MIHRLKCWPEYFAPIKGNTKTFDLRVDDRGFKVGDLLQLQEWTPELGYTGKEISKRVTYILRGPFFNPSHDHISPGLSEGWVILALGDVGDDAL